MGTIEGNSKFSNPLLWLRYVSQEIIRPTNVEGRLFDAHLLGIKAYPQVRIGSQVLVGDKLLNSVSDIEQYSLSRLSPDQIKRIATEMSISHHNHGIPVASIGSYNKGDTVVSDSRFATLWHQDKVAVVNGLRIMSGLPPVTIFPDDNSPNGLPSTALLDLHRGAQELVETMRPNPEQVEAAKSNMQTAKEILYGKMGQHFSIFYKMVQTSQFRKDKSKLPRSRNSSFWLKNLNLDRELLLSLKTENIRGLVYAYFNQAVTDLGLDPADYLWLQPRTYTVA